MTTVTLISWLAVGGIVLHLLLHEVPMIILGAMFLWKGIKAWKARNSNDG